VAPPGSGTSGTGNGCRTSPRSTTRPREGRDAAPFLLTLCFFGLGFAGLVLGIWPNIVPPSLSIWEAASPPSSQGFVLAGLVFLLPAILGYTYWSYSVFRGKIAADAGYH
jgi:cytochrome d ubiquinol oxidase subunit II